MYNNSLHVNPKIRNFWRDLKKNDGDFHIFKKNRNLVYFGDELSRKSYEFVKNRIDELNINVNHNDVAMKFLRALEIESNNEETLKNLAIKAVVEAFDIPEHILKPDLNPEDPEDIDVNSTDENYPDKEYNYNDLSKELKDQINKRILLNCISQGASIHAFYTMHHLVKNELAKINEELIETYDAVSVGTVSSYWKIDYSSMLESSANLDLLVQGSSRVDYGDGDDGNDGNVEDDEMKGMLDRISQTFGNNIQWADPNSGEVTMELKDGIFIDHENKSVDPSVVAIARTFVILCQELVKGSMELISLNSLKDLSEEDLKIIYAFSDKRVDEPRYIQISSEIWRNILVFLKHYRDEIGKITIPGFVMTISLMNPVDTENFFEFLLSGDLEKAANIVNDYKGDNNNEDFE
jgi:hypothetical protein